MLFNSYPFLFIYLPLVLLGFFSLSRWHLTKAAKGWLLISSLFFYGYWNIRFLPLLIGSIIWNYGCGYQILHSGNSFKKRLFLSLGVVVDLSLLFYFKYYNFFLSTLSLNHFNAIDIILPLGISFFTFTQIAYLVDAYQAKAEQSDIISYGLFVTIFPHLIAGPILHHKEMLKQFDDATIYQISWSNIAQGTFLFILGLFKKVIIADQLSPFVHPIFNQLIEEISFLHAWFGALAYTLQLYFDFSGYSDMAVGIALLFSLHLPLNFNSPYQADSIIDFWRRWHITLSHFLRDYLYIPLGGNRQGKWAKLKNLVITMLLGGLWHGAGWTFILWGAFHGSALAINHLWRDLKISLPNWLSRALTLVTIIVSWVIFRSANLEIAINNLQGMFGFHGIVLTEKYAKTLYFLKYIGVIFAPMMESDFRIYHLALVLLLFIATLILPNSHYWQRKFAENPLRWAIPCACLFILSLLHLDEMAEFLYYQF